MEDLDQWDDLPTRDVCAESRLMDAGSAAKTDDWDEDLEPVVYGQATLDAATRQKLKDMFRQQDEETARLGPHTYGRRCE